MEHIITEISMLLDTNYSLVTQRNFNQGLLVNKNIIVWNKEPLYVDENIYCEFKDAIGKRGLKHYNRSDVLHYADFCIALLCSRGYSLNHESIPSISDRVFIAAWSGLLKVSTSSTTEVTQWLNKYLLNRNPSTYQATFNTETILNTPISHVRNRIRILDIKGDQDTLDSLSFNEKVKNLSSCDDIYICNLVPNSSYTPENELEILRLIYNVCEIQKSINF